MTEENTSLPIDPLQLTTDQERRKVFLRYVNRAWLTLGIITLVTLPIFPQQRAEFIFLIAITFPTYLLVRFLNLSGKTRLAGVVFTLSVNFGFYGLFMVIVGELGAYQAFQTKSNVWLLMGLAVVFAGALVEKWLAPVLAATNSILLIVTRLMIAPDSDPRPSALIFWWMMALTIWFYEDTLYKALSHSWNEVKERKEAHKTIQETELKYRMLVERLPVVVYTSELGINGSWSYVSPQIELLLGFTADEWMADPGLWYRQVHPDDRDRQQQLEEQAWMRQESFEGEYRILTRNGRLIWVRDSAQILPPQNNAPPIVQGVLTDITERKRIEEALHQSESLLKESQIIANIGSYVLDVESGMWKSSDVLNKIFGIDEKYEHTVESWAALIHFNDRQMMVDYFTNDVLAKHGRFDKEYRIIRNNDQIERWVHGLGGLEINSQNQVVKMLGTIQDITERKLENEKLSQNENRLQLAQKIARLGIWDWDIPTDKTVWSGEMFSIYGISPETFTGNGQDYINFTHPDDRPIQINNIQKSFERAAQNKQQSGSLEDLRNTEIEPQQFRIIRPDESICWVEGEAIAIVDDKGQPVKMVGVLVDITARKQAEETVSKQLSERDILHQASQSLLSIHLDPEEIYTTLHQALAQIMPCEAFNIVLDDKNGGDYHAVYLYDKGHRYPSQRIPFGKGLSGRVISNGETLFIHDNQESRTPAVHYGTAESVRSILAVPLKKNNETIGMITAQSYRPHSYDERDRVLLETLAAQFTTVIENARLFSETARRAQEFTSLYETSNALSAENDLTTLLQVIVNHAVSLLDISTGAIYLYNESTQDLVSVVAVSSGIPVGLHLNLGEGVTGRVAQTQLPMRVDDYSNWEGRSPKFEGKIFRAVLNVPMLFGGKLIGVLAATEMGESKRKFTEADEHLLSLFAAQAAGTIHSARLREETINRAREFAALYETSNALSAENDLTTLLQVIVSHAATLLNASNGAMYLYDRSARDLVTAVATSPDIPIGTRLNLGEGVAGRVAQTHMPLRIDDYSSWEGRSPKYEGQIFRAILEVPMLFGGELIGVLTTAEMEGSIHKFTEADERLLSLFAAQAAGAIHSARLREETARSAQEFASLYETSKALSAENELNNMLQAIVEHAKKLLGSASSGMYLYLSETNELELTVDTSPYIPFGTRLQLNEGVAGRVAQTKLPLRVDDYSTWEGRSPAFEGVSLSAVLEVPMLYGGNLIGVLTADETSESARKFTEADERLLSLFASQAAGAIHSARLFEETRRRAEEFTVLYQTTRDLSVQQDLPTVLKIIVQQATTLLNVPNASMHLYDAAHAEMELVATIGPDIALGTRRKVNPDIPTYSPVIVDDYQLWEHRLALYDAIPYKALMAVPLLYGGNLLGILDVSDLAPSTRTFNEEDLHLLSLFAGQAASAIANARLFEETARRLDQLQALHTIDRAISSSFDLRPILNTVIAQTIAQLGVDAVDILLFHPHLQTLEYIAGHGFNTRGIEETQLRLGECFAGRAAFERRTIHIPNLPETGSNFTRASILEGECFLDYYAVPLVAKGEIKGVLEVFNRTALPSNPEWLDFLETLAGQAAITIDQTQLFDDLQRANLELIVAYNATIEGWSHAMDLRDKETEGHTQRVTEMTMALAKSMGIKEKEMLHIRRGALLHDIGKMGVPDAILLKQGKLTAKEWVRMKQHPTFSYEMLKPIKYLQQSLDIPYCHHEKWDGSGYPRGLQGEQIPLVARIFAVVDVWDAVITDRPYRKAWTKQRALKYIREQSGKHFEPKVVKAFLELMGKKTTSSLGKSTRSNKLPKKNIKK